MFAGRPIIGLVGGIGAGKSHVARLLEKAGCCRIASDEMISAAYTHPAVKQAVVGRFGDQVVDESGRIDRRRIADIVFRNVEERKWLEALLHPVANKARMELMDQASRAPSVIAYAWDSPLLFEAGLDELCDTVLFVEAPGADRLRRVSERGWDAAELARRENVQMPLDKKRAKAEYCVQNADADPADSGRVAALLKEIVDRFRSVRTRECSKRSCACVGLREPATNQSPNTGSLIADAGP